MKSCLGIILIFSTLLAILGGGALIWYLSDTAEFTRRVLPTAAPAPVVPTLPPDSVPRAVPVR